MGNEIYTSDNPLRIRCEEKAYSISGQFGYVFRTIMEAAETGKVSINPNWLLWVLKDTDSDFEARAAGWAETIRKPFVV